jgi:hypothetical protein
MFRKASLFILTLFACIALAETPVPKKETIRGWLSDEHCASSRARDGTYAATNPECAKECVAKGYKIVLIDPKQQRILLVTDQHMAKKNLGDYVEVTGQVDAQANSIKPESIKFLEKVTWPPNSAPATNANPQRVDQQ